MKIEEGKFYRTRNGRKVGPMIPENTGFCGLMESDTKSDLRSYKKDGAHIYGERDKDLISEWSDGPVRTITRQEIVPGTYDGVEVMESMERGKVRVGLCGRASGSADFVTSLDADELERAAAVLTALADALKASEAPR